MQHAAAQRWEQTAQRVMAARLQWPGQMDLRQAKDCALLAVVVAVTRLVFRSHYLYDLDSVNFALALEKFDPALLQPHPPGYYLYVVSGRALNALFGDPNTALVGLSVAASCGMAVAVYALARSWYEVGAARWAGFLFIVSPLCWFHGTVALTYIVEGFFSAVLGYLCWQIYRGQDKFLILSAIVLSVATGFRQSSILFLAPLLLLSWRKAARRQIYWGVTAFCLATLCWFVPMIVESGGPIRYFTALHGIWSSVPGQRTAFEHSFLQGVSLGLSRAALILFIGILCFGPFVCMPLLTRSVRVSGSRRRYVFTWLLPGLLFFTLIYLIFVNSGYLLILSPPIFAWLGSRIVAWLKGPVTRSWARGGVVGACTTLNVVLFLWGPWYCSNRSVLEFEAELTSMRDSVRERFSPQKTLLVSFDSHFMGFRHVGYYLPEFLTVVYPEAQFPGGKAALSMQQGQTRLLTDLPDKQEDFAMVLLPEGPAYDRYQQHVIALFPENALRRVAGRGRAFPSGALADLHYAFPTTLAGPGAVYTGVSVTR